MKIKRGTWLSLFVMVFAAALSLVAAGCAEGGDGDTDESAAEDDSSETDTQDEDGQQDEEGDSNGDEEIAYPESAIELIVPFGPGGSFSTYGEELANALSDTLGVRVDMVNEEGGGGSVGTNSLVNSEPDGYTIGLASVPILTFVPLTNPDLSYDRPPSDDYEIIQSIADIPGGMLAVQDDAPWESMEEMVEDAQSRPGEITVSTPGTYNLMDMGFRHFNAALGEPFHVVPFDGGGGDAMTALVNGQTDANIGNPVTLSGQLESGDLRGLAFFADDTFRDQVVHFDGLANARDFVDTEEFEVSTESRVIVVAPPGTPDDILERLEGAIAEFAASDQFGETLEQLGGVQAAKGPEETVDELVELSKYYEYLWENVDLGQQ